MRPDCDRMKLSWVTAPEFYVRAAASASRIAAAPEGRQRCWLKLKLTGSWNVWLLPVMSAGSGG